MAVVLNEYYTMSQQHMDEVFYEIYRSSYRRQENLEEFDQNDSAMSKLIEHAKRFLERLRSELSTADVIEYEKHFSQKAIMALREIPLSKGTKRQELLRILAEEGKILIENLYPSKAESVDGIQTRLITPSAHQQSRKTYLLSKLHMNIQAQMYDEASRTSDEQTEKVA